MSSHGWRWRHRHRRSVHRHLVVLCGSHGADGDVTQPGDDHQLLDAVL